MEKICKPLICIVISLFLPAFGVLTGDGALAAAGTTWYVDDDAPGDLAPGDPTESDPAEDGSLANPFDAIQEAIDLCVDGDIVMLLDGIYTGLGNRDIDFGGLAIHLRSENGPANCIMDIQGAEGAWHNGIYFHNGETQDAIVEGLTIMNGYANSGGAVYFSSSSSPTITNNVIVGNKARYGGGLCAESNSSPTITNNTIIGNTAFQGNGGGVYFDSSGSAPLLSGNMITANSTTGAGGGVYSYLASASISNNIITGNSGRSNGGGVFLNGESLPQVFNNFITGNGASKGGGIFCGLDSSPTITNNTIAGNTGRSENGGGIYCYRAGLVGISNNIVAFNSTGIFSDEIGLLTLRNNCVYNPDGYNYSGVTTGVGDFSANPKFVNEPYGKVYIQPGSPCINTGISSAVQAGWVDIDGEARIQGGLVDIGADESDGTARTFTLVVVRVDSSGDDANDGSSWALAKRTIQAGITAAAAQGGEVWVAAGTYNEHINLARYAAIYGGFLGTETDRSQRDWKTYETVLDAEGGDRVMTVVSSHDASAIDGFTILNGSAGDGGGIYCMDSSPAISNNLITENAAAVFHGGGIHCFFFSPMISNNTITANTANFYGGALYCAFSSPTMSNNIITGNTAVFGGGAIYSAASTPTISNNTIVGNRAGTGGGMNCAGSTSTITNCIFWANGDDIAGCSPPTYSCIEDGDPGVGNISDDPMFAEPGAWDDRGTPNKNDDTWIDGDYHLKSASGRWDPTANDWTGGWVNDATTSPCIDAGDPAAEFGNEPQPNSGRLNMGAYGNSSEASRSGLYWRVIGDANDDCRVDILDMIYVRNRLNMDPADSANGRADMTGDGQINILDMILVRNHLNDTCAD